MNTSFFYFIILWKGHADVMVDGPLGLEDSGAFRRGRDRDRGLDGAFQYSRRGLRLRRRGAYGIHRVSGPRCQGLCRKVASLRSGGRRLAVRTSMEHPIGALPRTPFPASRDFPSRGNERYEGITASHILQVPFRCSPLWWLAPPPFHRSSVGRQKESALMGRLGALLRPPVEVLCRTSTVAL